MFWIALQVSPDEDTTAWGWRALQFTPRVARVDEALVLETGASERLFGGRRQLLRRLLKDDCELRFDAFATGATALVALALLRLKCSGQQAPADLPHGLPLTTFSAAAAHLATLERIGCTTLGQLRALPRAGVGRRFGPELLQALDAAYGQRPERFVWLQLPARFDQKLELAALATSAPDLLFAGQHLLTRLQSWLQARNLGVLAVELEWTHDLRRIDGRSLPPVQQLAIRTAQPTQEMKHLRRLASEQLARSSLAAPANQLRLRTLQTVPWGGSTDSLLPEDNKPGEKLHQLVERLGIRLGQQNVVVAQPLQDHRPECMQAWLPAECRLAVSARNAECRLAVSARSAEPQLPPERPLPPNDPLYPPWLLPRPLQLQVRHDQPLYQGPLQLLTRARRLEAAWWDPSRSQPVLRDYFIARSASAGLLWIFRERLAADQDRAQWFLHGLYA